MAFGTGTHETTQLILNELQYYISSNDNVLDLGSGSGILAIEQSNAELKMLIVMIMTLIVKLIL